jgi:predicted molibdopterin-dependent oxidoreductase YjgC
MCDEGRMNFRYVRSDRRLTTGRGDAHEIVQELQELQRRFGADSIAAVASSYNTCEELFLFKKIVERMGISTLGFLTSTRGERWVAKNGFSIEADKTPNRAYLSKLFGEDRVVQGIHPVVSGLMDEKLKGLFVLNGIPDFAYPRPLIDGARKAEFVAVVDILRTPMSDLAHVVLPGRSVFEKDGTVINFQGRVQSIRAAVDPPAASRPELEILQDLLRELKERTHHEAAEAVTKEALAVGGVA